MAKARDRSFLPRLLRETVLNFCRETMDSHCRFIVDGIVCISLADDSSSGDCTPIVVKIHEQLCHGRGGEYTSSFSPQRLKSPQSDDADTPQTERERERRNNVPVNKKTHILRRVEAEAEVFSRLSSGPQCRSISEPLATKLPRLVGDTEDVQDGHLSDPTPMASRSLTRYSLSQCSEASDKEKGCRGSVSSPASSDHSSSTHEDVSVVGRAGSASPEEDHDLTLTRHVHYPSRPTASFVSRHHRGRSGLQWRRQGLSCQECGLGLPSVFSLERHHRQKHALFTCTQCLSTFTTSNGLNSHALQHMHRSSRRNNGHGNLWRRDSRQRHVYTNMSQPRIKRRQDESCSFCSFVGKRQGELKRHLLTHVIRNGFAGWGVLAHTPRSGFVCYPCDQTFSDPVTYTAHVKRHSQDPDFHQYRCCYCPDVLQNYQSFMLHQQAHALQLQPVYERLPYPRQFRSVEHVLKPINQPEDYTQRSSEDRCFSGNVPVSLAENLVKGEKSEKEKSAKENAEEIMEDEDGSGGPRQSWCSECHVGFPDEDTLIQHITETHESFLSRRPYDYLPQGRHSADLEESQNDDMDTSDNAAEKPRGGKDGSVSDSRDAADGKESDAENAGEDGVAPEKMGHPRRDADTEKRTGDGSSTENEGTLRSFPSRSEALDGHESNQSHRDTDSTSADLRLGSSPLSRCFPLTVIPIPLPVEPETAASPGSYTGPGNKAKSHITLVKPKDLVIRTEPYPHSSAATLHGFPLPVAISAQDLSLTAPKKPTVRTMYSLLNGTLQSGSYVRRSEPETNIKQEPISDPENARFSETPGGALRMTLPQDSLALSRESPDLPKDYSMPRVSTTSPRSTGSDGGRTGGADKPMTPDVHFRFRSPLQCPAQDCCEEFPTFSELEDHSARVHRRYLCGYCGKSFTAKPNRDRHVRVHTGVKPYKCQLCCQAFYRGDDLKYHVTTKHPRDTEY